MFGFGRIPCVVCDHAFSRRDIVALRDRNDIGVCKSCLERWQRDGAICQRCRSAVEGAQERGIFLDRYVFGHLDCGAARLAA